MTEIQNNTQQTEKFLKSIIESCPEFADEPEFRNETGSYIEPVYYVPNCKFYSEIHLRYKEIPNYPADAATIVFSSVNGGDYYNWDCLETLPISVQVINFAHDGITNEASKEQIYRILNRLPNLKTILYCGYYAEFDDELKYVINQMKRDIKLIELN
jgi:hypothetical protein